MLGIMLIDMQEKYKFKGKESLISSQNKLLGYAEKNKIPVFVLEYIEEGKTIPELQESLKKVKTYFIKKYNDNGFIKLNDDYLNSLDKSNDCVLFGDEWNEKAPDNKKLQRLLNKHNIRLLILTGIYKDGCMFKTAKGAKKRGYSIFTSDELMNEPNIDYEWYFKNSNHYKTLEDLIKHIESLNIN